MVALGARTSWTRQARLASLIGVWLVVLCFVSLWLAAGEVKNIHSYVKETGEGIGSKFITKCDNSSEVAQIARLEAQVATQRTEADKQRAEADKHRSEADKQRAEADKQRDATNRLTKWNGGPMCSQHIVDALADLDEKWGRLGLDMSVAHWGTGARVRRALAKLLKGDEEFTIGVLGGSLTFGHGLQKDDKRYPTLVEEGLKKVFPSAKIKVVNGAVPATGTDYFQACYGHHVPEESDLFVLEAAVNDLIVEEEHKGGGLAVDTTIHTEHLVRDILGRRPDNAILMLSAFGSSKVWFNGADKHSTVAAFYDIPRVTMRTYLYQYILQNKDSQLEFYGADDKDHPIQSGHEFMADILLYYLLREACRAESFVAAAPDAGALTDGARYPGLSGSKLKHHFDPFALPRIRVHDNIFSGKVPEVHSFCRSVNTRDADDKPALFPSSKTGDWEEVGWNDKHFWSSQTPGEKITFSDIPVSEGSLSVYYLRGPNEGTMVCWYDDQRDKATILQGFWNYVKVGSLGIVATNLPAKNYTLTCEISAETKARGNETAVHIISVMTS